MGIGEPPIRARHCPWATVAADPRVGRWLSTYWLVKEFGRWPPGRQDPQTLDAIAVIAGEHATITREEHDLAKLRAT
jgi:hypothetical protein